MINTLTNTYKILTAAEKLEDLICSRIDIARVIDILLDYQYTLDDIVTMLNEDRIFVWVAWEEIIEDTFGYTLIKFTTDDIKQNKEKYIALLRRSDRFFAISSDLSDPKAQVLEIR